MNRIIHLLNNLIRLLCFAALLFSGYVPLSTLFVHRFPNQSREVASESCLVTLPNSRPFCNTEATFTWYRSTGRKFVRLGVLFARNHANSTKIWTLKSRSNFLSVRSKNWTARCEHRDRRNFLLHKCVAAWMRGCSAGEREEKCKQILRA